MKATIRLQTTEEGAFAMATEGRGVPAATAVVERVTEEEEAVEQETQQQLRAGDKLAAVRIRTRTRIRPPLARASYVYTRLAPDPMHAHTHPCLPACLSRQARLAEERYLRTPEAQLERLAGRTAGAWPCPVQREIKISGTLAQRTAATAAAAAKVAARVARPGEGRLLGNSGAPVLLRLGTAAFAMLAEAPLAFDPNPNSNPNPNPNPDPDPDPDPDPNSNPNPNP